jgi:hypothetical protein
MKFADKYELSDAITTGRLETFVGRDVGSGERVLVYIFDAPVKKADQPTVLWALESFRAVAPEPPGVVIAAGKYGSTSYGYLVTQMPDDAALRRWTQAYELATADTREITVERTIPLEPPAVSALPRSNDGEIAVQPSFSQLLHPPTGFFGLRPPVETATNSTEEAVKLPGVSSQPPGNDLEGISFGPQPGAARQEPGEFTKQFFVGSDEPSRIPANEVPVKSAAAIDRVEFPADKAGGTGPSGIPVESAMPELGGFTALFRPSPKPEIREIADIPKRIDAARKVDDGKAGDFTKFFQGPFDGERPAEIPDVLPNVASTPRGKVPGEFTQMFGSGKDNPFAAMSSSAGPVEEAPLRTEPLRTEAGSFTRSFGDASQLSAASEPPLPTGETKGNGSQKTPAFAEPKWTEPVLAPTEPAVKQPEPPAVPRVSAGGPRASAQDGATQVFSVPGGHSAPSPAAPPSGPSAYTRIISGGIGSLKSSEEKAAAEEGPGATGGLPTFKMPAVAAPPVPKIAAPPAPKLPAAPAAPKVPALGELAPKPKPSYLPMIIILNVSLIIAVLLIVYFAIKH